MRAIIPPRVRDTPKGVVMYAELTGNRKKQGIKSLCGNIIDVELGTGKYAEGGGGRPTPWRYQDSKGNWHTTSGMKPRPYLRPAIEDHKRDYKEVVEEELKR